MLMLPAELRGRDTDSAAKHARKEILVSEAGRPGDIRDRSFRIDQQSFRLFDSDTTNFSSGCSANKADKSLFQSAPGDSQLSHDFRHADAVMCSLTNESQRIAHHLIVNRQRIGGMAHHDTCRRK